MDLKSNINKIHADLLDKYDVMVSEKSAYKIGNYVEFLIKENNYELKLQIDKIEISKPSFNWRYFSNPHDKNSHIVERTSNINNFKDHVKDIFDNKRFDTDYINLITK